MAYTIYENQKYLRQLCRNSKKTFSTSSVNFNKKEVQCQTLKNLLEEQRKTLEVQYLKKKKNCARKRKKLWFVRKVNELQSVVHEWETKDMLQKKKEHKERVQMEKR